MQVLEIFGEFFMGRKQKKGMLLASEVVKLVIALIGISLLIYLLFSLYYTNIHDKELNQAKDTIGRMKDIIQRVNSGGVVSEKLTDVSPSSWEIFSFVGGDKKPNSCVEENCLCICDSVSYDNLLWFKDRQLSECDNSGVCVIVKNLNKFSNFEIEKPSNGGTNVEISKLGDKIGVRKI